MTKKHLAIFWFVAAAMLLLATTLPYEKEWTLKKTGKKMWVYTRDRAGSEIKEVRLIMEVDASITAINAVLNDASRQPEWVFHCTSAKDLGGKVDTGWYYYSRIALPWPMDDRDVIAKVIGQQDGDVYRSKSIAAPTFQPEVEGCVRITDFDVTTAYEALPDGSTKITYEVHSEPAGAVPSWLVNLFIEKGPVETMTKLRKIVEAKAAQ
ncbi:MAG: START domain-containing protein [Saprospiraceae bacterium]